jgi:hypothetical protein
MTKITVISLETQVGIRIQRNKWANMDPRHTRVGIRCLGRVSFPCRPVTPACAQFLDHECSYPLSKSVCQEQPNYWYEKYRIESQISSIKVCNCRLDHCNGHRTCETLTSNETVDIPVAATCLSVVYPESKTDHRQIRPLHIQSAERYILHTLMILECYNI